MKSRPLKLSPNRDESQVASLFRDWISLHGKEKLRRSRAYLSHLGMTQAFHRAAKKYLSESDLWSMALTDELTGLLNRRGFLFLASQQLKLALRNGRSSIVFLSDVNGLKRINDQFGHAEGDKALIRTAHALEETFRDSDVLARFGGDEFAILALETADEGQTTIRQRIQVAIASANAVESRYRLSLSIGAASANPDEKHVLDDLLLHADEDLYEAQFRGADSPPRRMAVLRPIHMGPAE
jgi:two-component system, cell cycle response regulator